MPPSTLSSLVADLAPADAFFSWFTLVAWALTLTLAVALWRLRRRYTSLKRSGRERDVRMDALLSTAVDGVIILDAKGIVLEYNTAAERIFGWRRDEVIGCNVSMLMDETLRQSHDGFLSRYLQTGEATIIGRAREVQGLNKNGASVPIRLAIGHERLPDRDLFVGYVTDVTERVSMEQALRINEQQFRSLIRNIPGICYRALLSDDWPMLFISNAVERVTGFPAADFLGSQPARKFMDLVHADDIARVTSGIIQAILDDRPFLIEYRLVHRDGTQRWMWTNGGGVRDQQGRLKWIDCVVLDITERHAMDEALREAKERAEQAAAARAAFVANMSHEIRTPMNAILGFTDVMRQGELNAEQRRYLDIIRNAGQSLLGLLNEVLDTAKLDKGAVELVLAEFNLLALIDEVTSTLGASARAKQLALTIDYDDGVPRYFSGDEMRIRQILTNLLGNAIKFTESGSVTVGVTLDETTCVHLRVADTGIGIPPERIDAIFEPFTQADASMTRRFGGTGLGTTISKQLTELMNGRIWAESMAGKGSTFHVVLPLATAHRVPAAHSRASGVTPLAPLTILIADDVPQNLSLMTLLLTRFGHEVITASDGVQAAELAASRTFDLMLMDVQMSGGDGLAAIRRIRAHEAQAGLRPVPAIALTASVMAADRTAALAAGMDGFASKPIDMAVLSAEIGRVMGGAPVRTIVAESPEAPRAHMLLDAERGLERWARNATAYDRALGNFVRDHADLADRFAARRNAAGGAEDRVMGGEDTANDTVAMRQAAHRVRGVAANLGLERLAALLAEIEAAAIKGDALAISAMHPALRVETADAVAAIQAQRIYTASARPASPQSAPAGAPPPVERRGVRTTADALYRSLERGALDDDAMARLVSLVPSDDPVLQRLLRAVEDFDFDAARRHLREWGSVSHASRNDGERV